MTDLEEKLYDEAYDEALQVLGENGARYELMCGCITSIEYEEMLENLTAEIYEEKIKNSEVRKNEEN